MTMPRYTVVYPVTGQVTVYDIEAESVDEAIEKGWNLTDSKDPNIAEPEWYAITQVVEGNVYHGHINRIEVIKQDED